jgi:hypothetical protein
VLTNACFSISTLAAALNTLRKDGCLPYLLPRSLAEETREGEQAVIYHQPATLSEITAISLPDNRGKSKSFLSLSRRADGLT